MTTRLRYVLERALVRGASWRLAFIAFAILAVSVCGGLAGIAVAPADFADPGEAVWWAFLRLTDPGYLGDDEGAAKRVVSTAVTVSGTVLFMGALIAIMTQWLNETLTQLERGETPIALRGHLLVVGWSERSASILEEFLRSRTRVESFLARRKIGERFRVVVLVDDLDASLNSEVAERLGPLWNPDVVVLRAGSRLRVEHLERVAFQDAAAIVIPGNSYSDLAGGADIATVKTLLSIARHPLLVDATHHPRVVAELTDSRKAELADLAYPQLDVVPSDLHLGRLLVQNILNPGLSLVYEDLLTYGYGAMIFARSLPELVGSTVAEANARFSRAVVLGVVGPERRARLDVRVTIEPDDLVVLVATDYEHTTPDATLAPPSVETPATLPPLARQLRVLCLAWSDRIPALAHELAAHQSADAVLDVVSAIDPAERDRRMAMRPALPDRVVVNHLTGDITDVASVAALDPASYDRVVILGGTRTETNEETDARTLVAWLTLRRVLGPDGGPPVLVELTDPANSDLFGGGNRTTGETVVSPRVISALLAHVTLRGELLSVYDTLFSAGGPSLVFRTPADYGLEGPCAFDRIRRAAVRHGHVCLGMRGPDGVDLLPDRGETFQVERRQMIVLAPVQA